MPVLRLDHGLRFRRASPGRAGRLHGDFSAAV